jgi:sulfite exporter TauE/SafE
MSAFLMGLLGSTHCVGMCGGVATLFSSQLVQLRRNPKKARAPVLMLAFNGGRLGAYGAAGAVAGAFGLLASHVTLVSGVQTGLRLLAGLLMVGVGLYLVGVWKKFARIEKLGAPLWSRLKPIAARLTSAPTVTRALGLGALWGFMPCGLVYAALGVAIGTGSAALGAVSMAAFFLGTLPALLAVGIFSRSFSSFAQKVWVRRSAGMLIIAFGAVNVETAATFVAAADPAAGAHACCAHGHSHAPVE